MVNSDQTYAEVLPHIGILVLNRNGKEWLSPLYDSIKLDGYPTVRIYLVDNASDDGSVETTIERYPDVTIIRMPENLGYCMAYNLAMPFAFADGCEWVIWSNNDILLENGCLGELVKAAQIDSRIGVLGPAFLAWESYEPNYYMIGNHSYAIGAMKARSSIPIDVEWVEGSFLMVSRKCVESTGSLDPYLFFYWEEADFCRRARYQNWRVVLVPSALARHYAGASSNEQNNGSLQILKSKNYYIYKLTNPFKGFFKNFINTLHLFLVNVKQFFPKKLSSVIFHIRVFANVLKEILLIYKKWVRDRKGSKPPILARNFQNHSG